MALNTIPAPFIVPPSGRWEGNDGNWSTFAFTVGSPAQYFRGLPSLIGSEVWVPIGPDACTNVMANETECMLFRGAEDGGFLSNASSTWSQIDIFQLSDEAYLYGQDNNALFGTDDVALAGIDHSMVSCAGQTVAGYATTDFWLGIFGLNDNFTAFSDSLVHPSFLTLLKSQSSIPSLSFGYTAGASYEGSSGSLVLGGYDAGRGRLEDTSLSVPIRNGSGSLVLVVQNIVTVNSRVGTTSLSSAFSAQLDSATAQLWLPLAVCEEFERAFGLTYDPSTELYLVNDTIHDRLLTANPSVTFTLGVNTTGGATSSITFPYNAFDLNAAAPMYGNGSRRYFPIRRAANESQYVLGRAFLQEAYLAVDWERLNFTITQAIHQNSTSNVVPILPPGVASAPRSQGLSRSAIAGIVVACVLVLALVILLGTWHWRRRRRATEQTGSVYDIDVKDPNMLQDQFAKQELMSTTIQEMPAEDTEHELDSGERPELEAEHVDNLLMSNPILEMEGTKVGQEMIVQKEASVQVHELE